MATEQKSNGNAFEEGEMELKEVSKKIFQEPSSSKVEPAAEQIGASTSKPIDQDMADDEEGRKDVKPEDEKAQDDKAKRDRGNDVESKSDKAPDDKAKDDEGTGAKGKGGKGEKGKGAKGKDGTADHDTIQGDMAQDMTDAIPPQNVKTAIQSLQEGTQDTSKIEQEDGCGMKCLMYTVECCECVIS